MHPSTYCAIGYFAATITALPWFWQKIKTLINRIMHQHHLGSLKIKTSKSHFGYFFQATIFSSRHTIGAEVAFNTVECKNVGFATHYSLTGKTETNLNT